MRGNDPKAAGGPTADWGPTVGCRGLEAKHGRGQGSAGGARATGTQSAGAAYVRLRHARTGYQDAPLLGTNTTSPRMDSPRLQDPAVVEAPPPPPSRRRFPVLIVYTIVCDIDMISWPSIS